MFDLNYRGLGEILAVSSILILLLGIMVNYGMVR